VQLGLRESLGDSSHLLEAGKWYASAGFLLPEKRILTPEAMARILSGQGVLPGTSHEGMLLAPFSGIPYNPRVFNRQLPWEVVSAFILAILKFVEEAGSQ
jgi:hypothetical protein